MLFSAGAQLLVQLGPAVEPQLSLSVSGCRQPTVSNPRAEVSLSASEDSVVGLSVSEKKQLSSLRISDEGPIGVRQ
jgi:hypothetical protein